MPSNPPIHDEFSTQHEDRMVRGLHVTIRFSVRLLAALMVVVILWGVAALGTTHWLLSRENVKETETNPLLPPKTFDR
jgi:hypothetical protein